MPFNQKIKGKKKESVKPNNYQTDEDKDILFLRFKKLPPICTPKTTARAEGASKAKVTQSKVVLTIFRTADAILLDISNWGFIEASFIIHIDKDTNVSTMPWHSSPQQVA